MDLLFSYQGQTFFSEVILMNTISDIRLANARVLSAEYKNPAEFARVIDRESTQVSRFMGANPTKNIGDRMARHIEKACGKPTGWLDTDRISEGRSNSVDHKIRGEIPNAVPLILWDNVNDFENQKLATMIPCPTDHGPRTFATRVNDNTMTAQYGRSYPEGSIIYIDPDRANAAKSGDRVLAVIEGKTPTFKLYGEADGGRYLQSINQQYPIITREFEIVGLIIGMWTPE
jgi:SOS-response transcriptional repressor LexA